MQYRETPYGFTLVLDRGDEILEGITRFATQTGVRAAAFTGIGAVSGVTLGFYDLDACRYQQQSLDEELEVTSLTGNIAVVDDEPYPHLHGVFGRRDFSTVAGHVLGGSVSITLELAVHTAPDAIQRHDVDFCDLKLMNL